MADYQQKVVLRQTPKQTPTEFIQPEIKLESPEGFQTQNGALEVPDLNVPSQ
jgi:hypothetical protein